MTRLIGVLVMIGVIAGAAPANALWPDKVPVWDWYASRLTEAVQKAKEAGEARQAANAAIEVARQKFFADRKAGISEPESLQEFEILLWQKDIYYMTPYLNEGMTPRAVKQFEGVEKLTGGKLDGGIPTEASGEFEDWVMTVRGALNAPAPGSFWLPSQDELIAALIATSAQYDRYRAARDRAELWKWRKANRTAVPLADTPQQRADDYIKYSLDPEIEEAGITEQDKPDVYEKIKLWREELRAAIVDFEKAEPTREIVAECLRANYRQHPDNDPPERIERGVQRFMQETEPVAGLPPAAQFAALVHGFDGFSAFITRERGSRWVGPPPIDITRFRVKECATGPASNRMASLYNEGQSIKFVRTPYYNIRGMQYFVYPD